MTLLGETLEDGILALELERPQRLNALNAEMLGDLLAALERARGEETRVVTITGAGRSFCAGADVEEALGADDAAGAERFLTLLARVLDAVSSLPKPVVVGVQGHAAGGGAEIALEADLRVVATDAEFWFPDISVGSTPASVWQLTRMVGRSLAQQMVYLGRRLGATELERLGVACEVVEPDRVAYSVRALAIELRGGGETSLRLAKQGLALAEEQGREADLALNVGAMLRCYTAPEQGKAVARFLRWRHGSS